MAEAVRFEDVSIINNTFRMEHINLDIRKGYITAVTGGNGAGKTTLIGAIAGINGISGGSISIDGTDLYKNPVEAKNRLGFVFHKCPFRSSISPKNCMEMFGAFYQEFDREYFKELCVEFGLDMETEIAHMSKGQSIKLQLAFAMAHDAKVILLDDAAEGLDPVFRRQLKGRLRDIVADGEHTVVIATKIPEDIENIADYVVCLRDGRLVEQLDIEQINESCSGGILEYMRKESAE